MPHEFSNELFGFNIKGLTSRLLTDVEISGEAGEYRLGENNILQYGKTDIDLDKELRTYCESVLTGFEKVSTATLRGYLLQLMEEVFGLKERDATKVVLHKGNNAHFNDVVTRAIDEYRKKLQERHDEANRRARRQYTWEVPEVRGYNEETNTEVPEVEDHALLPFIRLDIASKPERRFEAFLEQNSEHIDWWYKNGDGGRQHYSIPYVDENGKEDLFYIDFVIRMKSGKVFLFDTKDIESDRKAVAKHNALVDYLASQKAVLGDLQGGVIIEDKGAWKYCEGKISDTTDLNRWTSFYPDVL